MKKANGQWINGLTYLIHLFYIQFTDNPGIMIKAVTQLKVNIDEKYALQRTAIWFEIPLGASIERIEYPR